MQGDLESASKSTSKFIFQYLILKYSNKRISEHSFVTVSDLVFVLTMACATVSTRRHSDGLKCNVTQVSRKIKESLLLT